MAQYVFTINGKEYKVNVKNIEGSLAVVEIDGKTVTVNIKELGKKEKVKRTTIGNNINIKNEIPPATQKVSKIKSPLPGIILKVMVRDGDKVRAGQDIIVLEAMKMENQIQASINGTVKKVFVKEGDTIQQDAPLVEIEP